VTPATARYLLRLDDLCPTVRRDSWQQFRALIDEFRLRPILAVVPDNRDPALDAASPDPDFWEQIRGLEAAGAEVALHGYRHVCASRGHSYLGLHSLSEFAGIDRDTQLAWLTAGLGMLHNQGLNPRVFVAPRHGFDRNTLRALRAAGMTLLSDGFANRPFRRHGITWISQQLWGPVEKPCGVWTICMHPNTVSGDNITRLRVFLRDHHAQFSSVEHLLAEFPPTTLKLTERFYASVALWRVKASRGRRRFLPSARQSSNSR